MKLLRGLRERLLRLGGVLDRASMAQSLAHVGEPELAREIMRDGRKR
jgi:hypothetical protein